MNTEDEKLAKLAYHAYGKVTNFKNYQGLPMPEWADLTEKIKEAWVAACRAAVEATKAVPSGIALLVTPGELKALIEQAVADSMSKKANDAH